MDQLKEARLRQQRTQAAVAFAAGTSENYYRRIEAGAAIPSIELLRKIMVYLKASDPEELGFKFVVTETVAHVG